MRAKVAKRLRRMAEIRTHGKPDKSLVVGIRRLFRRDELGKVVKDENGKIMTYNVAGTARHEEGTTRRLYKSFKKRYKEGDLQLR